MLCCCCCCSLAGYEGGLVYLFCRILCLAHVKSVYASCNGMWPKMIRDATFKSSTQKCRKRSVYQLFHVKCFHFDLVGRNSVSILLNCRFMKLSFIRSDFIISNLQSHWNWQISFFPDFACALFVHCAISTSEREREPSGASTVHTKRLISIYIKSILFFKATTEWDREPSSAKIISI